MTDASSVQVKTLFTNSDVTNLPVILVIKYSMSNQKTSMYLIKELQKGLYIAGIT